MAKGLHNEIVGSTVPELINSPAFEGAVILFDNPVIHTSAEDVERFRIDIDNICYRECNLVP